MTVASFFPSRRCTFRPWSVADFWLTDLVFGCTAPERGAARRHPACASPRNFCLRVASAAAVLAPRDPRETPVRAINSMIMPIPPVNWLRNRESNTGEKNASILNCVDRKMHRAPDIGAVPFLFAGFRCGIPGALKLCKLFGVKKSWDIKRDSAPVK